MSWENVIALTFKRIQFINTHAGRYSISDSSLLRRLWCQKSWFLLSDASIFVSLFLNIVAHWKNTNIIVCYKLIGKIHLLTAFFIEIFYNPYLLLHSARTHNNSKCLLIKAVKGSKWKCLKLFFKFRKERMKWNC